MPSGQAMLDAIVASGAIKFQTGWQNPFIVSYRLLRRVLRPEHRALAAAGTVNRTDTGTMTFTPIGGGNPVTIPATLVVGADGKPQAPGGIGVALSEPATSGKILIAAAGDGETPAGSGPGGRGGDALVLANAENLLIALGGHGGDARTAFTGPVSMGRTAVKAGMPLSWVLAMRTAAGPSAIGEAAARRARWAHPQCRGAPSSGS